MKKILFIAGAVILLSPIAFASPKAGNAEPGKQASSAGADQSMDVLSGKVAETMNSGGYTYVLLEKRGKKIWVAVPEMKVKVGQKIGFQPGMEMKNFTSKSLNRTFEHIIFSAGPLVQSKAKAENTGAKGHQASQAAAIKPGEKIEKAAGPDAYTVADIYAQSAGLDKKTAVVKGRVVKVSAEIMGKNWIHLQDGSGDAGSGTNDLVATTQDLPAVGEIVTMKGTVYQDKDFGAGYKYRVIIEEATVQR